MRLRLESLEDRVTPVSVVVNTLTDGAPGPGDVRLRDAITAVDASTDPSNTISFATGLTGTLALQSALPAFGPTAGQGSLVVTVAGPGSGSLSVTRHMLATTNFDLFSVNVNTSVTMSSITMTGNPTGRGVFVSGALDLSDSVISSTQTTGNGGGIAVSGSGFLDISNVQVNSCKADGDGGGIYVAPSTTFNLSSPRIVVEAGSQLFNNDAQGRGGGMFVASPANSDDDWVQIAASTINQNSSTLSGGGLYFATMGLGHSMQVTISGSTITANRSRQGSGGALFTGVSTSVTGNSGHGVSGTVTSLAGNSVDNSATTSTGWLPFPIDDVS